MIRADEHPALRTELIDDNGARIIVETRLTNPADPSLSPDPLALWPDERTPPEPEPARWETTIRPGHVSDPEAPEAAFFARSQTSSEASTAHERAIDFVACALDSTVRSRRGAALGPGRHSPVAPPPGARPFVPAKTPQTTRTITFTISEEQYMLLAGAVRDKLDVLEFDEDRAAKVLDNGWGSLHNAWQSVPDDD